MKKILKLFILGLFGFFITSGLIFIFFAKNLPNPENLNAREFSQSTKIFDRSGENILYNVHGNIKRTIIPFEEIPVYAISATLAIEDNDFYKHSGIDFKAIIRAALSNFRGKRISQGGSTITQQLIKNVLLTPEKTFTRKIKEAILALEMERRYDKKEILSFYFNQIPYGSSNYGIEAASQSFFGKHAHELTLGESAILAAMTKAPSYYSPYGNQAEELLQRQKLVLKKMNELGYISEEEFNLTKEEEINFKKDDRGIKAPHFTLYVRQLLNEKYGEDFVERAGLKVYTTLDLELQEKAEKIVKEKALLNEKKFNGSNAALIAIDPGTGEILAMVGSRDYFEIENDGNVNVAIRLNQPGSAFKPVVYAAAFQKGYTPETILFDLTTNFGPSGAGDYIPHNYNFKTQGPVTIRQALAQSLNIPAVKTLYLVGINDTINLAEKMKITSFKDRQRLGLSLVLGGGDVSLLELTTAFSSFAQEGILYQSRVITRIEDSNGRILEQFNPKKERVLDIEIARQINSILSDNIARIPAFGERNNLTLGNRPVAVKTGTTDNFIDAWAIGYTPQLITGVWVGNNDNKPMNNAPGVVTAAPIWNQFMAEALKDKEIIPFNQPKPIETTKPILKGNFINETTVLIDKISGKRATEWTPKELIENRIYKEIHSILYYINKKDPLGPKPENPYNDPQFERWEESVLSWVKANGFVNQIPPEEFDDIHTPENQPSFDFNFSTKQSNSETELEININTENPSNIKEADVFIDGRFISKITSFPVSYAAIPQNLRGSTITIKLYDSALNSTIRSKSINLNPSIENDLLLSLNDSKFSLESNIPLTKAVIYKKGKQNFDRVKEIKTIFGNSEILSFELAANTEQEDEIFAIGIDSFGKIWISNTLVLEFQNPNT